MTVKRNPWRRAISRLLFFLSFAAGITVIVAYSYDLYKHGKETKLIGYFSAAGFVLLTFPISIRLIYMHLSHWVQPAIQKYIVRIVWMIPLYSVESWLALRFRNLALYIETMRECYEAYGTHTLRSINTLFTVYHSYFQLSLFLDSSSGR